MGCWRFQQNLNSGFQLSLSKISEICSIRQEGWIFTFHWFVLSKKSQFLEDWIGNQESVFTQTCHSSSLSGEETAVPFFCSSNLSLRPNQLMKFEILAFSPPPTSFAISWKAELETRNQILLKLCTALHCQDRKLLPQFCSEAIYLLDKTNWWNLKLMPFRLLEEISQFFGTLNWKPWFRFDWNLPQAFSVRTGNWGVHLLVKQFMF